MLPQYTYSDLWLYFSQELRTSKEPDQTARLPNKMLAKGDWFASYSGNQERRREGSACTQLSFFVSKHWCYRASLNQMQYQPALGISTGVLLQPGTSQAFSFPHDPPQNSCVVVGAVPVSGMPLPCYPMSAAGQGNMTSPMAMPVQYPLNRFPAYHGSLNHPFQCGSPTGCHNITEPSLHRADSKQHRAYETKMRDPKYRWGQFLNQAKQRGLAVGISFEMYQQLIYSACHYCSQHPTSQTRVGIDRINSCGNYEITNCVPCCARCNFMKGSLNYREFIDHARLITFSMRTRDLPYTPAPLLEPPFETCGKRRKRAS